MDIGELTRKKLQHMLHELKAVNLWDYHYILEEKPDFIETAAWNARRSRVVELQQEFHLILKKVGLTISGQN